MWLEISYKKSDLFNAGFAPKRTGPHTVLERIAEDVYAVNQEGRPVKMHGNRLYRSNLPVQEKRHANLPTEDQDQI